MKKYLLSFAVLLMAMVGLTACGDDDEDGLALKSLAKTSWVGKLVDEGMEMDVTISFPDDKNGVQYAKGTFVSDELPMPVNVEQYAKFTYTFDGNRGKAIVSLITTKTPFGSETYDPREEEYYEEGDEEMEFSYNAENNTLEIIDGDEVTVLTKTSYKEIQFVGKK